jgi:uncharacterized protein (TIGR02391 family)
MMSDTGEEVTLRAKQPPWDSSVVMAVCEVLAQTSYPGLTWAEIERILPLTGVKEITDASNKRTRLYATLLNTQYRQRAGNCIIAFINEAMKPARYINEPARFADIRDALNEALSFNGVRVNEQGVLVRGAVAKTLSEAAAITGRLKSELTRRQVHPEVVKYCNEELIKKSIFHAMFEVCKGLAERIRTMSGLTLDGAELVDAAFSTKSGSPVLKINPYQTQSEISDHKGLGNLIRGVFGTFRNNAAHTPRIIRPVKEQDALDLFSTLSYIHRRLDEAP